MNILINTGYIRYEEEVITYFDYYRIYSTFYYFNSLDIIITSQISLKDSIFLNQNKNYNKYYLYEYLNYEHTN